MTKLGYILVADIGGTKLATAIFEHGKPLRMIAQQEQPSSQEEQALFDQLINGFEQLYTANHVQKEKIEVVSVGLPGVLNLAKGVVLYQNNLPWSGFPLVERLLERFPNSKIIMDNDVYMAASGEYQAREFTTETFVYVTLSTGIACCTIANGQFLRGVGMAGEIGFSLTDTSLMLEQYVAGPALEARINKQTGKQEPLSTIMEKYYRNDEIVLPIIAEAVDHIARQLHNVLILLDPHVIVLGGGVFNHHPKLVQVVQRKLGDYLTTPLLHGKENRVEASIFKGNAGLIGAASRGI